MGSSVIVAIVLFVLSLAFQTVLKISWTFNSSNNSNDSNATSGLVVLMIGGPASYSSSTLIAIGSNNGSYAVPEDI